MPQNEAKDEGGRKALYAVVLLSRPYKA